MLLVQKKDRFRKEENGLVCVERETVLVARVLSAGVSRGEFQTPYPDELPDLAGYARSGHRMCCRLDKPV